MKNYIIGALAVAVLGLGAVFFFQKEEVSLGAVASPIVMSPYFGFGDVIDYRAKTSSLTSATTTVCSLTSPSATSTLIDASIRFEVSSSTASIVTFSKGTGSASTTPLQAYSVGAGAQATINLLATTTTAGSDNLTFAPSTKFNVTMAGGASTANFSPSGVCQATWQVI